MENYDSTKQSGRESSGECRSSTIFYISAMRMVQRWLNNGWITKSDTREIDTILARKFGVSDRSIWRTRT